HHGMCEQHERLGETDVARAARVAGCGLCVVCVMRVLCVGVRRIRGLEALERMTIDLPIVVRLDGTNAAEGRAMLADAAPPNLHVEETMLSAAERVVELAKERR